MTITLPCGVRLLPSAIGSSLIGNRGGTSGSVSGIKGQGLLQDKQVQPWQVPLRLLQVGSVALPLIVGGIWALQSWRATRDAHVASAQRQVELVREYALRVIQTQDMLLGEVASYLQDRPADDVDRTELAERLRSLQERVDFGVLFGAATLDGTLTASSRQGPLTLQVGDREYFQALKQDSRGVYVDRVTLQPVGTDTLIVAERPGGPTSPWILVAAVNVQTVTDFFGRVASGENASASLLRADGKLLVRHRPDWPPLITPADSPAMRAIGAADRGTYETRALADGVERIYAFSRVDGLPLFAVYGVAESTIRRAWLEQMYTVVLFLVLTAGFGFAAASQALSRVRSEQARREAEFDRRSLAAAQRSAALNETLLRELNHRVKNNLQTILALIRLRRRSHGDNVVLDEIDQRVWAIAEVHRLLYGSDEITRLDLSAFLHEVCRNNVMVPPERPIAVTCEAEPVEIDVNQATPVALIIVELLTNAVKHAFPDGRSGTIRITLRDRGEVAELEVMDDGMGLPPGPHRNSGLRLVEGLVEQLEGSLEIVRGNGTTFRVVFPKTEGGAETTPQEPESGAQ